MQISNSKFLQCTVGKSRAEARTLVAGFRGDPGVPRIKDAETGQWRGEATWRAHPVASYSKLPQIVNRDSNTFFCISQFSPIPQSEGMVYRRRKDAFVRMPCLFLDDIGSGPGGKIAAEKLKLSPSWVLETSPDNYQVGYILAKPIEDRVTAERLLSALVSQGLSSVTDPGMRGVTRYGRLPEGVNAKAKYVKQLGQPFVHKLRYWSPDTTYSLQEMVEAYGLDLDSVAVSEQVSMFGNAVRCNAADDHYLPVLCDLNLVKSIAPKTGESTWVAISCPWLQEHTGAEDTGAAYRVGGGFKCHHGHCQFRTFTDLKDWLRRTHCIDTETLDRAALPYKQRPLERFRNLCNEGLDDLAAYAVVLDEYGDRGAYGVIWSAVQAGLGDNTIIWLFDRARFRYLGNETDRDKLSELIGLINQVRSHLSNEWSTHTTLVTGNLIR